MKRLKSKFRNLKVYTKLRYRGKKGGGIMILHKDTEEFELVQKDTKHQDLLVVEGKVKGFKIKLIASYFDSSKARKGKEYKNNRTLQEEIEEEMDVTNDTLLYILGDHNGRTTLLEPDLKKSDANGEMVEDWVGTKNKILLNADDKCQGIYTFGRGTEKRSAIDQVLTNEEGYKYVHSMFIDENGEITETSDHNVVLTYLNLKTNWEKWEKGKSELRTYFSLDEDRIEMFIEDLKTKINPNTNLKNLHTKIEKAQERNLKIKKKMTLGKKCNKMIVEPEWADEELKSEVKKRRKLNGKWRKSQINKEPPTIVLINETNYRSQKLITKKLTAEKKSSWEKRKVQEAKESNGKTLWKIVNEIQGKTKPKNKKNIYI